MRALPCISVRQQPTWRHLVRGIDAAQPLREQPHLAEPGCARRCAYIGQARIPAQDQRRIDVRRALLIGEPGEAPQYPLIGAKVVSEATPDAQIAIELKDDVHCTPPATGQGCAIDRSPSMSSRAYIREI